MRIKDHDHILPEEPAKGCDGMTEQDIIWTKVCQDPECEYLEIGDTKEGPYAPLDVDRAFFSS